MKVRLIITYIFNLIDLIATMYLVSLFGLSVEGNPIGRWLIQTNLVYVVKIAVVGLALLLLWKFKNNKFAIVGSWVFLITFSLLAIYLVFIQLGLSAFLLLKITILISLIAGKMILYKKINTS